MRFLGKSRLLIDMDEAELMEQYAKHRTDYEKQKESKEKGEEGEEMPEYDEATKKLIEGSVPLSVALGSGIMYGNLIDVV